MIWNKTNSNFSLKLTLNLLRLSNWSMAASHTEPLRAEDFTDKTVKLFLHSICNNYARKLGFPKINQVWVALLCPVPQPQLQTVKDNVLNSSHWSTILGTYWLYHTYTHQTFPRQKEDWPTSRGSDFPTYPENKLLFLLLIFKDLFCFVGLTCCLLLLSLGMILDST